MSEFEKHFGESSLERKAISETAEKEHLKETEEKLLGAFEGYYVAKEALQSGKLSQKPTGYETVSKKIRAISALKRNNKCYDDIGTTANGGFTFEGYERQLS